MTKALHHTFGGRRGTERRERERGREGGREGGKERERVREKEKGRREALTIRSSLNLALGREAKLQGT